MQEEEELIRSKGEPLIRSQEEHLATILTAVKETHIRCPKCPNCRLDLLLFKSPHPLSNQGVIWPQRKEG